AEDADGNRDQGRDPDHDRGAHDGMLDAGVGDRGADWLAWRQLRVEKELRVDHRRQAFEDREPQHEDERDQRKHGQAVHRAEPCSAPESPPLVPVHAVSLASRDVDWTRIKATTLTTSVTRIRTSPSSISAAG